LGRYRAWKKIAFRFAEAFYPKVDAMIFLQILGAILIGFLVGGLARLIVPGQERGGCLTTILIGIAGSFVAFFIGTYLFGAQFDRGNPLRPTGFISSLLGAILILIIYHLIRRRRQP
jgi:uncharacterized membrane protein YeaQ/YmgE (transglycosylase-associated protein family)